MDMPLMTAAGFQFLRPLWLLALLLLPVGHWLLRQHRPDRDAWQRAVDAHLLPHLLQQGARRGAHGGSMLLLLGATLAILALAGPSWRQQTTPLWQVQSPLVIALDLSSAMSAADLPPSRLTQARFKLTELLKRRRGGQVGLLVYADDAFTVAPITRDAQTVQALLDSLSPDLMPVDGQRADRAITRALKMLRSAGFAGGDILLLSDHADDKARSAAAQARAAGFHVSTLGLGTVAGAPVSGKEGFRTGADGQVRLARLDAASLSALAADGGGVYAGLTQDDADLRALDVLDPQGRTQRDMSVEPITTDDGAQQNVGVQRSDDGIWLLLLLLPLALIGFRRGWLALLPLTVLGVMAPSQPASAASEQSPTTQATADRGWEWASLWQRDDQRAHQALQQGAVDSARALARDPALQGAAAYRGNDYAAAAKAWAGVDNADAHYNRGNALANAGNYEDALAAYDEALKRTPDMPDALANRKAVEDLLKQQQKQQQQEQKQNSDASQSQKQEGDASSSKDSSKNGASQPQEAKDAESAQQDNKDSKQSDQPNDAKQDEQEASGVPSKTDNTQSQQADPSQSAKPKDQPQAGAQGDEQKQDQNSKSETAKDRDGEQGKESSTQNDAADNKPAPSTAEAATEQQAKEAAKRAMEQALAQDDTSPAEKQPDGQPAPIAPPALTEQERAQSEQQQALQQWLRRVPDDPGALLRRKFALEYQRRQAEGEDQ